MKTRSRKPADGKAQKPSDETSNQSRNQLGNHVDNPPNIFVLPKDISQDARILDLPNPASWELCKYLVCPRKGFYEFTKISVPAKDCRSWLISPSQSGSEVSTEKELCDSNPEFKGASEGGYVLQEPRMFVATPVDALFILLPFLLPKNVIATNDTSIQEHIDKQLHYQSRCDYMDNLYEAMPQLRQLAGSQDLLETRFQSALDRVCQSVDAGQEKMYRLNTKLLCAEIVKKAREVVKSGLPSSLEEHFVQQVMAVPELSIRREDSSVSMANENENSKSTTEDSQDSGYVSQDGLRSQEHAPADEHCLKPSNDVLHLLRLRTAVDFIARSYISKILQVEMRRLMSSGAANPEGTQTIDFSVLEEHFSKLEERKKQAQALRSLSDNISRKRPLADDDEEIEKIDAKKRKKEEEETKKKNMSRGVKQLEKVDRSGMQKLSSFFTKAPPKK